MESTRDPALLTQTVDPLWTTMVAVQWGRGLLEIYLLLKVIEVEFIDPTTYNVAYYCAELV